MRFYFYTSANQERNNLIHLFQEEDPMGVEARARQCDFPVELARQIRTAAPAEWQAQMHDFINQTYAQQKEQLAESVAFYKAYWAAHEAQWLDPIERALGKKIPPYYVLITHFIAGTSDWYGADIAINARLRRAKNPHYHVYILLFEMILSQVFMHVRAQFGEEQLSDWAVWELSELTAFTILHHAFDCFDDLTATGYAAVDEKINRARAVWQSEKSLDAFLTKIMM